MFAFGGKIFINASIDTHNLRRYISCSPTEHPYEFLKSDIPPEDYHQTSDSLTSSNVSLAEEVIDSNPLRGEKLEIEFNC